MIVTKLLLKICLKDHFEFFAVYYSVSDPFLICELDQAPVSYVRMNILVNNNGVTDSVKEMMLERTGVHPSAAAIILRPIT